MIKQVRLSRQGLLLSLLLALVLFVGAGAAVSAATGYGVGWWVFSSGGGRINGGAYNLGGSMGQPDASTALATGGEYSLHGGFLHKPTATGPMTGAIYLPIISNKEP